MDEEQAHSFAGRCVSTPSRGTRIIQSAAMGRGPYGSAIPGSNDFVVWIVADEAVSGLTRQCQFSQVLKQEGRRKHDSGRGILMERELVILFNTDCGAVQYVDAHGGVSDGSKSSPFVDANEGCGKRAMLEM